VEKIRKATWAETYKPFYGRKLRRGVIKPLRQRGQDAKHNGENTKGGSVTSCLTGLELTE